MAQKEARPWPHALTPLWSASHPSICTPRETLFAAAPGMDVDSSQRARKTRPAHTWAFRLFPMFVVSAVPPGAPTWPLCRQAIFLGQVPRHGATGSGHSHVPGSGCQVAVRVAAAPPPTRHCPTPAGRVPWPPSALGRLISRCHPSCPRQSTVSRGENGGRDPADKCLLNFG